jgi:hypothetical protein
MSFVEHLLQYYRMFSPEPKAVNLPIVRAESAALDYAPV